MFATTNFSPFFFILVKQARDPKTYILFVVGQTIGLLR